MPLRRVVLLLLALLAGGATAVVVPALGAGTGHAVTASDTSGHQWTPSTITIAVGDTVTWSYPTGTSVHNVHFTDGASFPDQPSSPSAPGWTVQRTFNTDDTTYHYQCALHSSMRGTIVVGNGSPATTTTTTTTPTTTTPTTTTAGTTPSTTPTTPVTTPTTTTPTPPADTRAPRVTHVRIARGRLGLTLSEPARFRGALTRSGRRVRTLSKALHRGAVSVRLGALKPGRYRVRFTVTDKSGNATSARTVKFRVR